LATSVDACDELDCARMQTAMGGSGLDRYRMKAVVGSGCFGSVRLAETEDGRKVAIKAVSEDAGREMREVEIMRTLSHPCVVQLIEAFWAPGLNGEKSLHIVMEYMPKNLHQHLSGRPCAMSEVRGLGFQLMRAMAFLDGRKVCHRDVKPENLLLGEARAVGTVRAMKIADFGSAKPLSGNPSTSYICARWWRAPELVVGCTTYGSAVDWWSAGCVLAEMMTGRPLFPGSSTLGQLDAIMNVLGTPTAQELDVIGALRPAAPGASLGRTPSPEEIAGLLERPRAPRPLEDLLPSFASQPTALELVSKMLVYDPSERLAPARALCSALFHRLPEEPGELPTGIFDFTSEELSPLPLNMQEELHDFAERRALFQDQRDQGLATAVFGAARSGAAHADSSGCGSGASSMLSCFGTCGEGK